MEELTRSLFLGQNDANQTFDILTLHQMQASQCEHFHHARRSRTCHLCRFSLEACVNMSRGES